jgi:MFS family permease
MSDIKLIKDRNLHIVFAVTLMAVLGVSSITPAFPAMAKGWGVSEKDIAFLITAFTIPGIVLSPFVGILADRLGRKKILVPSLFLFGIAGTACSFSDNFSIVLVLRVLQGLGAAALGSLNATLLGDMYTGQQRTEAIGYNASVLSAAVTVYPIIGGAIALVGFRYPFLLSLAAIPIGLTVLILLRNPEPRSDQSLKEYLGGTWQYLKHLKVAALFAAGVISFLLVYGAYLFLFAIYIDETYHVSPFIIGIIQSSMSVSAALASSQLGRISRKFSQMSLIKAAFPMYAVGFVLIPLMPELWTLLIPAIIIGAAQGMNLPSIVNEVAGLAPLEHRATFMALNNMMLRLGQTLGPVLMGILLVYLSTGNAFYATALIAIMVTPLALVIGLIFTRR